MKNDLKKLKEARDGNGPYSDLTHEALITEIRRHESVVIELMIEAHARTLIIDRVIFSNFTEKDGQTFQEVFCCPRDAFIPATITKLYIEVEEVDKVNKQEQQKEEEEL